MSRERKIWVARIVIIVLMLSAIWFWALRPKPRISVPIDDTIEKMAEEKGIPIMEVASLENKFVEGERFGGAGGMGAPVVRVKNAQQFFEIIDKRPGTKILYVNEKTDTEVTRRYWGINDGSMFVIEATNNYNSPCIFCYKIDKITSDAVVFEKSYEYYITGAVIMSFAFVPLVSIIGVELLDAFFSMKEKKKEMRKEKALS